MKTIKRAYKYRLYPNKVQIQKLSQAFGCVRFVWNNAVESFNEKENIRTIPSLKEDFVFLGNVSCAILQQKQRDFIELKRQLFSKTRKTKQQRPRFKKKGQKESFRLPNQKFKLVGNKIQLERIGKILFVQDRVIKQDAKFLSVTISKNSSGQYFASILVEETIQVLPKTNKTVGIDLGIKSFVVTSDNKIFEPNRKFRDNQSKLKKAQQHLSRKKKGSIRFKKCKLRVAKIHQKIANQRSHYIHSITTELVRNYGTIVIEDLNVKGMMKNKKLSKSIADASFSMFRQQLSYKCDWHDKNLVIADRFYPSSKTCSSCGEKKDKLDLKERTYECAACGLVIVRDYNSALNLKAIGVSIA